MQRKLSGGKRPRGRKAPTPWNKREDACEEFNHFIFTDFPEDWNIETVKKEAAVYSVQFVSSYTHMHMANPEWRVIFLKVMKKVTVQDIRRAFESTFPSADFKVTGIPGVEATSKHVVLYNLPREINEFESLRLFLKSFERGLWNIDTPPGFMKVTAASMPAASRLCTFLPHVPFPHNQVRITSSYEEVPIARITGLPCDCTKEEVIDIFNDFARVTDMNFYQKKGDSDTVNATITCASVEDRDKLIEEMDLGRANDKELHMYRLVDDEFLTVLHNNTILVPNIGYKPSKAMKKEFSKFGKIYDCKIKEDPNHKGVKNCYLTFFEFKDAMKAVEESDRSPVFSRNTTVLVFNFDCGTTAADVANVFNEEVLAEPPISIEVRNNIAQGEFPLVVLRFRTPEDATTAICFGNTQFSGHMKLFCKKTTDRKAHINMKTIRINGLADTTTTKDIVEYFSEYGKMENIRRHGNKWFVTFCSKEASANALEADGGELNDTVMRIHEVIPKHYRLAHRVTRDWIPKQWMTHQYSDESSDYESDDEEDDIHASSYTTDNNDYKSEVYTSKSLYTFVPNEELFALSDDEDTMPQRQETARGRGRGDRGRGDRGRGRGRGRGGQGVHK